MKLNLLTISTFASSVALLVACSKEGNGPAASASSASAAAGVSVTTVRAQRRDFPVTLEATGTVTPMDSVEVRAQVSANIAKVHIKEGQFVKRGETLFTLDARVDQANVAKAQAQLAKDLATLADAKRQLARSQELLAQKFIAQGAVDTNQASVDAAQATVNADRAAIEAAQVGLSFNTITSSGAGRAGAINVYAGSYVSPTTPLVTITQLDPITIAFNLPQRNLDDALGTLRAGGGSVEAVLPEGRGRLTGKLQFVDNAVDASSGTVRVKAVFTNADQRLWPGAFVNVHLQVRTLKDAIVVPQAAIVTTPKGRIVYTVDANRKAQLRNVNLMEASGTEAVVTGVEEGERVVVDGRQNLRPGAGVIEHTAVSAAGASVAASGAPQ